MKWLRGLVLSWALQVRSARSAPERRRCSGAQTHGWSQGDTRGAEIIFIRSAFTLHTGRDHWEVLLLAHAIENRCYIIAPNQYGPQLPKKHCYGHSMIIDPWGTIVCQVPDGEGLVTADVELTRVSEVRPALPALDHWAREC